MNLAKYWSGQRDSNPRPSAPKARANAPGQGKARIYRARVGLVFVERSRQSRDITEQGSFKLTSATAPRGKRRCLPDRTPPVQPLSYR